jgi:hypothetical protein
MLARSFGGTLLAHCRVTEEELMSAEAHTLGIRRLVAMVMTTLAAAGLAAPAFAKASAGFCSASLSVTISPSAGGHRGLRMGTPGPGSASCTGSLGPWLMGGKAGWSTMSGELRTAGGRHGNDAVVTGGLGRIWTTVPRYGWFYPSMVSFVTAFQLHLMGGKLVLTGYGRLLPTPKSPLASSFAIAGVAAVVPSNLAGGRPGRALVTLRFGVRGNLRNAHGMR